MAEGSGSDSRYRLQTGDLENQTTSLFDDQVDEQDTELDALIARIIAQDEAELIAEENLIDLTQDDDDENEGDGAPLGPQPARTGPRRARTHQRNPPLHDTHRSVRAFTVNGVTFKIHDFAELRQPVGDWTCQFVSIQEIWVDGFSRVLLRGLPYTRARNMKGRLEWNSNEICQILEVDADDGRVDAQQALVEIHPEEVLTLRALNKTNTNFPDCRFGHDAKTWQSRSESRQEEQGPLTCRWAMRVEYRDARYRKARRPCPFGGAMIHLSEEDVQEGPYRTSDQQRQRVWRGPGPIPLSSAVRAPGYTMADMFCGAGGTSCGAQMAGFKIVLAVDKWDAACRSYQRNFPTVRLFQKDITDFISDLGPERFRIDVLHLSPPCQYWSPIHVRAGPNDDANIAALFCTDILDKTRPRLVTLEQTFGLTHDRHAPYFNAFIKEFTRRSYSIQWRVAHLVEWGLPQTRKRLIMIAACPGEALPPWPAATHGPGPGLRPYATEAQAIDRIPQNATLHDVRYARRVNGGQPRNPHSPFPRTITCGGADSLHHGGQRAFTPRELACLQGFPVAHRFEGTGVTEVRRQIGNAFPPSVVRVIYGHLRRWLERRDGRRPAAPPDDPPALSTPGSWSDDHHHRRRRCVVNGDLGEDEALRVALQASREVSESRSPVVERDLPVRQATGGLQHLSVAPADPDPDPSPLAPSSASSGASAASSSGWGFLRTPMTSSRATSVTFDFSPSPSPSSSPSFLRFKRKRDAHNGDFTESPFKRLERPADDDGDEDEVLVDRNSSLPILRLEGRRGAAAGSSGSPSLPSREASPEPFRADGRALAFGNRLGKLPATRATSSDWRF